MNTSLHHQLSRLSTLKLFLYKDLCNLRLCLLSLFVISLSFGCEDEVPLPLQLTDAEAPKKKETDAEPMPIVPQSAEEIFKNLPYPPDQIIRKPGDAVGNLKRQNSALKEVYSPRFLIEHRTDGPFRNIVYQLDAKEKKVEAVTATFHPDYMHQRQYTRLQTYMKMILGKGEKFRERHIKGRRWKNLDYRIELHIDTAVQDLVLVFNKRGAETLERTMEGLPKKN